VAEVWLGFGRNCCSGSPVANPLVPMRVDWVVLEVGFERVAEEEVLRVSALAAGDGVGAAESEVAFVAPVPLIEEWEGVVATDGGVG
jgi:hypothetical protein